MFEALQQNCWFQRLHDRMKLDESCDALIMLNFIELERSLVDNIASGEEKLQILLWNHFQEHALQLVEALRCDSNKIPLLSLFLPPLLSLLGTILRINLQLNKSGALAIGEISDFDSQMIFLLEQFSNSDDETVIEAIVLAIRSFSITIGSQEKLKASTKLLSLFKKSLMGTKPLYMAFMHSVTLALQW